MFCTLKSTFMKSLSFIFIQIILFLSLIKPCFSTNIVSTATGGDWTNPATWQGGIVPSAGDHAFLIGPVSLNANTTCASLTVHTPGILQNTGGSSTISVTGNFINEGIVRNQVNQLYLNVGGNIEIRGETTNHQITCNGAGNQTLWLQAGKTIAVGNFNNTSGSLIALSALYFYNTNFDFDYNQLVLQANSTLDFTGSGSGYRIIREINIIGQGSQMAMRNQYALQLFTGSDLNLGGIVNIHNNGVTFTGNTVLNDTLQNYGSNSALTISGNFTNHGLVRNFQNQLSIHISGNLTNYGIFEIHNLTFNGTIPQSVICADTAWFDMNSIVYTGSASLVFTSNINIYNASVNLNNASLTLAENSILSYQVFGTEKVFQNAVITGNNSSFLVRGGYVQNVQGSDLFLRGLFRVGDNNSNFTNSTLLDTLSNFGASHSVTFHGNFSNVGRIYDQVNLLTVNCTGNVNHFGEWENWITNLNGTQPQHLTFSPGNVFAGSNFNVSNTSGSLIAHSDLVFTNTAINFNFANVVMPENAILSFSGADKQITRLNLYSDNIRLIMSEGCYINDAQFFTGVIMEGLVRIGNNNCFFHHDVTNLGTLGNFGSHHFMSIAGAFYNSGTVENLQNQFTIHYQSDLTNAGSFSNFENRITGTSDQDIRLEQELPVNARVILESNIGGSGWQWYKNGVILPGATSSSLTFNQITAADYGVYYCISSAGTSRLISIAEKMNVDFTSDASKAGSAPLEVSFTSTVSGGFTPYTYYWQFGDGTISSQPNPVKEYLNPGYYSVSLTVSDNFGATTEAKNNHVFVCQQPQPDFTVESVCFGEVAYFYDLSGDLNMKDSLQIRYASTLIDFSSEWEPYNWGAIQTLGEPDVYPSYGDSIKAWAPRTPNGPREWIELRYDDSSPISAVWIYETLKPGTVDSVYARNPVTNQWELLWSGTAFPAPLEARIFKVEFPETNFPVSEIRIAMNTAAVSYWNEIDAVALVMNLGQYPSEETVYEWDINNDGIIDYTDKGDIYHLYEEPGIYQAKLRIINDNACEEEIVKPFSVNTVPEFIEHPQDLKVCVRTQAVFSAEALMIGDFGVFYQWVGPLGYISGATSNELVIDNANQGDAGQYFLIAYNQCGFVYSDTAMLVIQQNPTAYAGPDAIICEDEIHGLYDAEADHYSQLLWESSGTGIFDDSEILNPHYTPSAADALAGEVILTFSSFAIEPCEFIATSSITLTIWLLPEIISQPESQQVCEGSDVEFSVVADGTEPLSYQWYGPVGLLAGEENSSLQLYNVSTANAGDYYVMVTNACDEIYSESATLTVQQNPTAYAGPDTIICEDEIHGLYDAEADHYSQLLWESSGTGIFDDSEILNPHYTPSAADALAGEVILTFSSFAIEPCEFIATSSITLTIWLLPEIISQPESQQVCEGSDVEFSVVADGTEPLSYQWYGPVGLLAGEENSSLQLYNVSTANAGDYYVMVTNACDEIYSESATLTVQEPPSWEQNVFPEDQFAACADVPEAETLTATGNFGETLNVDFYEIITDSICVGNYILTRTWMATDSCGFTISHNQTITVEDTQAPVLINPEITCQELNQNKIMMNLEDAAAFDASALEGDVAALYQDDCSEPIIAVLSKTTPNEENSNAFWSFIYEFNISDGCGNPTCCEVVYSGGLLELSGLVVTDTHCYGSEGMIITGNLTVEPGGDITIIAGVSVQLKPDVQVMNVGRLHAHISNEYCEHPIPLVASKDKNILNHFEAELTNNNSHSFSLYPNPTLGKFTLEFNNAANSSTRLVEIYSMMGELVLSKEVIGNGTLKFDLSKQAGGVYIIRLTQDDKSILRKIVRN
jgi:PKD repeat protein